VIYGDETVVFFELYVPRCALLYGMTNAAGTCLSVLGTTGTRKCFNGRKTCQSLSTYTPTETVTLRFSRSQEGIEQYGPVIPSLQDVSISPLVLNLAGMNDQAAPFGQRETVSVSLDDHLYSDLQTDKYRLERYSGAAQSSGIGYDPSERGTFWGKFLARNPYYLNMPCAIRTGVIGQPLASMRVQNYLLTRIDGPNDGQVKLALKDLFSLVEARKAVAPKPSQGRLQADITNVAGSATLIPGGVGATYGVAGYVRIGSECMAYTRVGDVLTLTQRNALNTQAAAHSTDDAVQEVLTFISQRVHDIAFNLVTSYTTLPAASINYASWATAAASLINLYTAYITTPTPVADLIGELEQQAGFSLWPDVVDNTVHFKALVASTPAITVDDASWIVDGSLSMKRDDAKRASLFAVYYGQIDPTKSLTEETNFRSRVLSLDSTGNFSSDSTRKVFSRWIPQFGRNSAQSCGDRLLAMFTVPPLEAKFKHHALQSGELALADLFYLSTAEIQDDIGAISTVTMAPISIALGEEEDTIGAQEVRFAQPLDPAAERTIYIDASAQNLNLRSVFDSLYPPPTGVETVTFEVSTTIRVGSSSTSSPAIRKGTWPVGCVVKLRVMPGARVQGKGGVGGHGAGDGAPFAVSNATAGEMGGPAVDTDGAVLIIDNQGEIWAGGGGGGGGASREFADWYAGGGGGGGAGSDVGPGGSPSYNYSVDSSASNPQYGSNGTTEAGGSGGLGGHDAFYNEYGGNGGNGGGPGLDGTAGTAASNVGGALAGGGLKGNYIVGNAFVTWLTLGDRRGGVA
jgi:hypothetical protein